MDAIEKRISRLKEEKLKVEEKVTFYKSKSDKIADQIESLENQRITSLVRGAGCSLDDLITAISLIRTAPSEEKNMEEIKNEVK